MRRPILRTLPLLAVLFACPFSSRATTVTYTSNPQVASSIEGLVVDGTTYNITFSDTYLDPTFFNNPAGAKDAANALIAALNNSTAIYVQSPITGGGLVDAGIVTVDDSKTVPSPVSIYSNSTEYDWQPYKATGNNYTLGSNAIFSVASAPTPEPSSLILLGSGMLTMAGIARRRFITRYQPH